MRHSSGPGRPFPSLLTEGKNSTDNCEIQLLGSSDNELVIILQQLYVSLLYVELKLLLDAFKSGKLHESVA